MGHLVSIIGNSGVGKTTLAEKLSEQPGFFAGKEELEDRPFQTAFAQDLHRYALANQLDFLLYRIEQERHIRSLDGIGVQDGGLDLDHHLFTRLFHHKGYLSDEEYTLCRRLYDQLRSAYKAPDIFVYLDAPIEVAAKRFEARNRSQEIACCEDLDLLQGYLDDWLDGLNPDRILAVNATHKSYLNPVDVNRLRNTIIDLLS
jgi:deoxyadenosine/deoxycytidine kinase